MNIKATNYFWLVMAMVLGVGCGESFSGGQKVWIHIPAGSLAQEGHATATVTKAQGKKIKVKIQTISAPTETAFSKTLRSSSAEVDAQYLSPFVVGKKRHDEVTAAYRQLRSWVGKSGDLDAKKLDAIEAVGSNHNAPELARTTELLRLRLRYLDKKLALKEQVINVPAVLKQLRSINEKNESYSLVVNAQVRDLSYMTGNQIKTTPLKALPRPPTLTVSSQSLVVVQSVELLKQLRQTLDRVAAGEMSGADVIEHMADVLAAEEQYLRVITDNGKRLSVVTLGDALRFRKHRIALGVQKDVRVALANKAGVREARTVQEAEAKFVQAQQQAAKIEQGLETKFLSNEHKKTLFVAPTESRLKLLVAEEASAYQFALDADLEPAQQRVAAQSYLDAYPNGQFRDKVKALLPAIDEREKLKLAQKDLWVKNITPFLSGKHPVRGSAGYKDKKLSFHLQVNHYNEKSGQFTGRITWPAKKGAVNKVRGTVNKGDMSLNFTEVDVIREGNWRTGGTYKFHVSGDSNMAGTHSYRVFVFPEKRDAVLSLK